MTVPDLGNIGPAAVPFTLAKQVDRCSSRASRCCCLGIGSGLNTSFAEIIW